MQEMGKGTGSPPDIRHSDQALVAIHDVIYLNFTPSPSLGTSTKALLRCLYSTRVFGQTPSWLNTWRSGVQGLCYEHAAVWKWRIDNES